MNPEGKPKSQNVSGIVGCLIRCKQQFFDKHADYKMIESKT